MSCSRSFVRHEDRTDDSDSLRITKLVRRISEGSYVRFPERIDADPMPDFRSTETSYPEITTATDLRHNALRSGGSRAKRALIVRP
jgi:hypothetical protein